MKNLPDRCGRKSKGGTSTCIKPKGHVSTGDKRHSDGKYQWGKWW